MTREEKRKRIKENCINCEFCPLYDAIPIGEYCFGYDADIERNYYIMFGKGDKNAEKHIGDRHGDPERRQEDEEQ